MRDFTEEHYLGRIDFEADNDEEGSHYDDPSAEDLDAVEEEREAKDDTGPPNHSCMLHFCPHYRCTICYNCANCAEDKALLDAFNGLIQASREARELIEIYSGFYSDKSQPNRPNRAVQAIKLLDAAIQKAEDIHAH